MYDEYTKYEIVWKGWTRDETGREEKSGLVKARRRGGREVVNSEAADTIYVFI